MGRPSKLTEATIRRLEQAIRLGATYAQACTYAGIGYSTFREWMNAGKRARRGRARELVERIERAEAEAAIALLAKIEQAANNGTWQAAAWKLERRYPEAYGRRRVEFSGPEGGPVRVEGRYEIARAMMDDPEALAHASEIIRRLSDAQTGGDAVGDRPEPPRIPAEGRSWTP